MQLTKPPTSSLTNPNQQAISMNSNSTILTQTNGSNFLHFAASNGVINLRTLGGENAKHTINISELQQWLEDKNQKQIDCYFLPNHGGQSAKEITHVSALWIDVDAKDSQWDSIRLEDGSIPLPAFHITPSMVIRSGSGGFHAYWILNEPVEVAAIDFKFNQCALINHYQSDKGIHDLCRIMRLPGSNNHKHDQINPCFVEYSNDQRYELAEILKGLPELKEKGKAATPHNSKSRKTDTTNHNDSPDVTYIRVGNQSYSLTRSGGLSDSVAAIKDVANHKLSELGKVEEGGRNTALHTTSLMLFSMAATSTEDLDEWASIRLTEVGVEIGLDVDEIAATIQSAQNSDNVNSKPLTVALVESITACYPTVDELIELLPKIGVTSDRLWLNLMDQQRYIGNSVIDQTVIDSLCVEIFNFTKTNPIKRGSGKDTTLHSISKLPKEGLFEALVILSEGNKIHPFRSSLSKIKGMGFSIEEEDTAWMELLQTLKLPEVTILGLKLALKQSVSGVYNSNAPLEIMPILYGKQGTGKTRFWQQLYNLGENCKTNSGTLPNMDNKDSLLGAFGIAAYVCDEVSSHLKSRNMESTKALLSQRRYNIRKPYDKTATTLNRECIFVGTSNVKDMLTDTTGNRRILILNWTEKTITGDLGFSDSGIAAFYDSIFPKLWSSAIREYDSNSEVRVCPELRAIMESSENDIVSEMEDVVITVLESLAPLFTNTKRVVNIPRAILRMKLKEMDYTGGDYQVTSIAERYGFISVKGSVKFQGKVHKNYLTIPFTTFVAKSSTTAE